MLVGIKRDKSVQSVVLCTVEHECYNSASAENASFRTSFSQSVVNDTLQERYVHELFLVLS